MSFANVVAAGVEPQVLVAVLCAVLLAVLEHTREDIGNSAVVAAAVAGRQHHDVAVLGGARIAVEAAGVLGHLPIPLGLGLEVAGLRRVVLRLHGGYGLAGGIVSVVLDGHVAEEVEEHDEDGDGGDGEDNGPAGIISIYSMYLRPAYALRTPCKSLLYARRLRGLGGLCRTNKTGCLDKERHVLSRQHL